MVIIIGRVVVTITIIVVVDINSCVDSARYDACAVEKPQQNRWSNVKLIWLHGETFSDAAGQIG